MTLEQYRAFSKEEQDMIIEEPIVEEQEEEPMSGLMARRIK